MKRSALVSAAALFLLLATVGLLQQRPDRRLTPTSYGTGPDGYKAAYDLLAESGVPVGRHLEPLQALPPRATAWFIDPLGPCAGAEGAPGEWLGRAWVLAGGTAVGFLSPHRDCTSFGGEALPARTTFAEAAETAAAHPQIAGSALARPRALPLPDLRLFDDAGGWTVVAGAGKPFALERALGAGRLVVVADSRFLANAWLDQGDSAPLAVDLVAAWGPPLLDERDHGFRPSDGAFAYLLSSPAMPVFASLALLGLAFVWWGAALAPPLAVGAERPAPTLEAYVLSLAALYARSGDAAGAAERYREFAAAQLRRRLGLPPDAPLGAILGRLERRCGVDPERARLLRQPPPVASEAELRQQARALDEILREASR